MESLTLRYGEDPATGLPRLQDPGGRLALADLEALGREVGRHFERLAHGPDGQLLSVDGTAGPHLPRHFRVNVTDRDRRCPTLLLEAVPPPPPVGANEETSDGGGAGGIP